jgi:hypothetical protein
MGSVTSDTDYIRCLDCLILFPQTIFFKNLINMGSVPECGWVRYLSVVGFVVLSEHHPLFVLLHLEFIVVPTKQNDLRLVQNSCPEQQLFSNGGSTMFLPS